MGGGGQRLPCIHLNAKSKKLMQPPPAQSFEEIEEWFASNAIPDGPVRLNPFTVVVDPRAMVAGHMPIVRANPGKELFRPYLERLIQLREAIENSRAG